MELCADYQRHFIVHGRDVGVHARDYLTGLLGRNVRKSIDRIGEELPGSNHQGMRQFISDSPWF
jgi:SRSO17 transposase